MRTTPAVLVVFLIVLYRWAEMSTGWSEAVLFPVVGLAGTVLIDRLVLPPASRLSLRAWGLNVAILVGIGALVAVLAG